MFDSSLNVAIDGDLASGSIGLPGIFPQAGRLCFIELRRQNHEKVRMLIQDMVVSATHYLSVAADSEHASCNPLGTWLLSRVCVSASNARGASTFALGRLNAETH